MADGTIELPLSMLGELPIKGNVIEAPAGDEGKGAAEKAAQEKQQKDAVDTAARLEKEKKEKEKNNNSNEEEELTEEEIQATLDELAELEEAKLTDEQKEFIKKYTASEASEIDNVKSLLEETYGVKLEAKYDNGIDGLKQLTNDVVPVVAENMFKEAMGNVPYLKEFYEHVISGRSINTFLAKNETPSFEKVVIKPYADLDGAEKTNAIKDLKDLVKMDLTMKGNAEEDVNSLLDLYEANGSLYDKGKQAKENLSKTHKANVQARVDQEEARIKQIEQDALKEIKDLTSIIDKNSIVGLAIPDGDIKSFKEALFKPIDNKGNTRLDLMREKLTLEQRGFIDYIIFKEFKLPTFKKSEQSKSFNFTKKSQDNNKRVGARLFNSEQRSEGVASKPTIDMSKVDYKNLMKATG